jgi:death-on-curing protein
VTEPVWLFESAILTVHNMMITKFGGSVGLRDDGLPDFTLTRPVNLYHYKDCTEYQRLAAVYAAWLAENTSWCPS